MFFFLFVACAPVELDLPPDDDRESPPFAAAVFLFPGVALAVVDAEKRHGHACSRWIYPPHFLFLWRRLAARPHCALRAPVAQRSSASGGPAVVSSGCDPFLYLGLLRICEGNKCFKSLDFVWLHGSIHGPS